MTPTADPVTQTLERRAKAWRIVLKQAHREAAAAVRELAGITLAKRLRIQELRRQELCAYIAGEAEVSMDDIRARFSQWSVCALRYDVVALVKAGQLQRRPVTIARGGRSFRYFAPKVTS